VKTRGLIYATVFEEEGDCIVCLEMRADELMRRLISGELTNYRVVLTSPDPLQYTTLPLEVMQIVANVTGKKG
jgi:hypothetical protein